MADKPDYYDDLGYGRIKHERLLQKQANREAWAANVERRRELQVFAADTRRNRRNKWLPFGGSMLWSKVSDWADRRGVPTEARKWRDNLMPHWQAGDAIPMRVVKEIVKRCMQARGERKLRRMGHSNDP